MNVNLELYKLFYRVAINGSISKTAEDLYISQPAITQSIQKLEYQLDGKLFYRIAKGVKLTEEGTRLFQYLEESIILLENAENKFKRNINLQEGEIKIDTDIILGKLFIYNAIIKLSYNYPKINIKINNGKEKIERLIKDKTDIAIIELPCEELNDKVEVNEFVEITDCFFTTKEYYEIIKNDINSIKDIEKYDIAILNSLNSSRESFDKICRENKLNMKIKYEVHNLMTIIDIMQKQNIIGFGMKEYCIKEFGNKLKIIDIDNTLITRKIGIATLKNNKNKEIISKLIELVKENEKGYSI